MAYPALRTTKEDDNVDFLRRQFFTSDQTEAVERKSSFFALGAGCLSTPQSAFANQTQQGNVNCPSSTREDTNSNVRRTSKHFPTIKVDFLTNNVVLRVVRRMTVSGNATIDFRTESERLVYGSRSYIMQFQVFGGAGLRGNFKPPYLRNG